MEERGGGRGGEGWVYEIVDRGWQSMLILDRCGPCVDRRWMSVYVVMGTEELWNRIIAAMIMVSGSFQMRR